MLTIEGFHLVKFSNGKLPTCYCEGFTEHSLCAHVFALEMSSLEQLISQWKPNITRQMQRSMPSGAGKNENEKSKKRVTQKAEERYTTSYSERVPQSIPTFQPNEYQLVFLTDIRAITCYGCGIEVFVLGSISLRSSLNLTETLP